MTGKFLAMTGKFFAVTKKSVVTLPASLRAKRGKLQRHCEARSKLQRHYEALSDVAVHGSLRSSR